ncbi:MAG: hypothetical protein K4571_07400 [Deltaproteobacteria bacterium]
MKRFWLVLLSLGLIVAFSTSAMAVDLKFSGEFYAAGMYVDKSALLKDGSATNTSSAFYFQRLRLNTTFVVHPGLFLTTRADILERAWGASRAAAGVGGVSSADLTSAGTRFENENINFDLAYVTYISPIGIFLAGYQIDGAWGTVFGDNSNPTGKIGYMFRGGPFTAGLQTGKNVENSRTAINAVTTTDRDSSFVTLYGIYGWKGGQAGLLFKYIDNAQSRGATLLGFPFGNRSRTLSALPYVKAQLGPVALQAELIYTYGQIKWDDEAGTILSLIGRGDKIDLGMLSAWVDATADFGKFYVGGTLAYLAGDDPSSTDKIEGGGTGGFDWNPCLIMFNYDMTYWQGGQFGEVTATTSTSDRSPMSNAYFAQLRVGARPVDKLDIMLSGSWAHADKTLSAQWESREYGYEIDLTGTYKITNNLSYMLGGGYFFTGDWYKGINVGGVNQVQNNFMVINKLTLTF